MRAGVNKIRIGDLLVDNGEIQQGQLEEALDAQRESGLKLGRILVDKGFIDETRLLVFLAEQLGVPFVDLKEYDIQDELVALLPETYARRYRAVVLAEERDGLLVGMADPIDIFAYDELERQLARPMHVAVVRESDLIPLLDRAYRRTGEIVSFASELDGELSIDEFTMADMHTGDDDTPVARLLQSILEDAVQVRASDVHIEPDESVLRLRQRVDGVLQEQILHEVRIAPALVSRLKLMAGLNISEKRLPQDGRFEYKLKNTDLDVRLSTLPTTDGESVVMRLLDHSNAHGGLDTVGMDAAMLERFRRLIRYPNGLLLVTGPTGSGKTTTLYGALHELNSSEKKIITAEDPVEVKLDRVNQVQINAKIGLDFASVLRSALRQDPDIVLVGEIRDHETAEIALRAAMTGHLVMTTLHTNDAVSSALRLMDIGVPGYMIAASVRAFVAQRLIRRVCPDCSEAHKPDAQELAWLRSVMPELKADFVHGRGCNRCNQTGFHGRYGVFELLEMSNGLADALRRGDNEGFAREATLQKGYRPLLASALAAAAEGITTLAEAMALAGQEDETVAEDKEVKNQLENNLIAAEAEYTNNNDLRH